MKISETFATAIQKRIEPVVKVSERHSTILLNELCDLVITPQWERYIHQTLQEYTEALDKERGIAIWISGSFGSGKSLLMKMLGTLLEGGELEGRSIHEIFLSRLPLGSTESSDIHRFLVLCQQHSVCSAIGGNLHAQITHAEDSLTLVAFRFFAQERGYTDIWSFAWAIEYQLDERGLLPEFRHTVSKLCGKNWDEIIDDVIFYSPQLYEAASIVLPEHFSSPAAAEQATYNAQRNGITPDVLVKRLYRWCVGNDKAGKQHRLLLQFDELGQWLQAGKNTIDRIMELQVLVEVALTLGHGRIWIAVTAHGDIQELNQNLRQEHYAKINQRFLLQCKLSNENINIVVQERLLRKTVVATSYLQGIFQQQSSNLYDLSVLKETQRNYPSSNATNFAQFYPYLPWIVAVIPDITKGIAQVTGRNETLASSIRTMISMIQNGILTTQDLLESQVGRLICLADLYKQFDADVPLETRNDLLQVRTATLGGNDYTTQVACVLYLLGKAKYIPCTIENILRSLVSSIDENITKLEQKCKIELERLISAGYAKNVKDVYVFLSKEQRSLQEEILSKQDELFNRTEHLIFKLKDFEEDDALRFDSVSLLGSDKLLHLVLDGRNVRNANKYVEVQVYSPLQYIIEPILNNDDEIRRRSQREPNTFFLRMANISELREALAQAAATDEVVTQIMSTCSSDNPEYKVARQIKLQDLAEYKRLVRHYLALAVIRGMLFFRGSAYYLIDSDNAAEAVRNTLSQLLPLIYARFNDLPHRINDYTRAVKDALSNVTSNHDLVALKVYNADGTLNESNALLSTLRSRIPQEQADMGMISANQLSKDLEKPPFGWDSNCVKVGLALLLRASACRLIDSGKIYTDPQSPEVLQVLIKEQRFKVLRVQLLRTEVSVQELLVIRGHIETIFGVKPALGMAILNDKLKEQLQSLQKQVLEMEKWASVAVCSLPLPFEAGASLVAELLESNAPNVRLPYFMREWETLLNYMKLTRELVHFKEKHGKEYVEVRSFFTSMINVDNPPEEVYAFIQSWRVLEKERAATELARWSVLLQDYHVAHQVLTDQITALHQETQRELATLENSIRERVEETSIPKTEVDTAIAELRQILNPLRERIEHISPTLGEIKFIKSALINQRTTLFNRIQEIQARYQTVASMTDLATLYTGTGKYEQAEPLLKRTLAIYEQILEPEHPNLTLIFNNFALLYYAQGKSEQAEPLLKRTLAIYERILKLECPDLAQSLNTLEEGLDLERNYLDNVISLNSLGLLLQKMGDEPNAHLCFEQILKILECSPASKHPYTTGQQFAIQETQDWMRTIIQDMSIAQISQSKLARTTALNRVIGKLSDSSQQLDYFSAIGRLLIERITGHWREVVTREASRIGNLAILERVRSPYIFTPPVKDSALIGREDIFEMITSLWSRQGQRNSLLIHGHRRMGKTSVAQALSTRCNLGSDTQLVYLSLEGQSLHHEGDLYQLLSFRFWLRLKNKLDKPNAEDFAGSIARSNFDFFLAQLDESIENTRFILVLDEFETIYIRFGSFKADEVIAYLRAQTVTYTWLTLALVGLSDLDDLRLSYNSSVLGWESIQISFLDTEQVKDVLANPPQDPDFPLDYSSEALQTIASLTNGQPYLVQVIGDRLVKRYNRIVFTEHKNREELLNVVDVRAVIEDPSFYATAAAYFDGVWGQATRGRIGEVALLKVLAEHTEGLGETDLRAIANLDDKVFTQSIRALIRHDVVCNRNRYIHYAVPLMRRWVHDTLCGTSISQLE